ncbi:MAG: DUF1003 domain-containing protein [Candidatus Aenigmarchaeota archaeon]|nr:DUF1003 domain-containing protein [Candidatus Aenigmarchaeota archaeon]
MPKEKKADERKERVLFVKKLFISRISENLSKRNLLEKLHSFEWQFAQHVSNFAGSMPFVYYHVIWFAFWILANQGYLRPMIYPFDPFPYGLLTMIVSLEAIFLATFIMITQNRQALIETVKELEEEKESQEEEQDVEEIQKDLDDIKRAMNYVSRKVTDVEELRKKKGKK